MAYKPDTDLEFLKHCTSEDLEVLVAILTKDTDGEKRFTETLTANERYTKYCPDHRQYWDLIAGELQCFGAHSLLTILRGGEGILYREVLTDVCDKMNVNYDSNSTIEMIERDLLIGVLTNSMEEMTFEQLQEIVKDFNLGATNSSKQDVVTALQASARFKGFSSYNVAGIVANAVAKAVVGRGLLLSNASLIRLVGVFAGPIGWVFTTFSTALDIGGAAFPVTIPCVIQVAFLRVKMKYGKT